MSSSNQEYQNVFPLNIKTGASVPDVAAEPLKAVSLSLIPVTQIRENPHQTREDVSDVAVEELRQSIAAKGVLQPIIVRPADESSETEFILVAGERRLRAATLAGVSVIPALVYRFTEQEALEVSIIENAQRENLNPIEEAYSYKLLVDTFSLTQNEVAELTAKSRSTITNALRLLQLDPRVIELIKSGEVSAGHGRALLALPTQAAQYRIARRVVLEGLSVRTVERIVQGLSESRDAETSEDAERVEALLERQRAKVIDYLQLEKVNLSLDPQGRKRLSLVFESEASWKRFISKIRE